MRFGALALLTTVLVQALATQAVAAPAYADTDYQRLANVRADNPGFVEALVELQKIHYRAQDWQKFFAYAMFYRKKIIAQTGSLNSRLISLELMALSKHCRQPEAQLIGTGALAFAREHGLDVSEIETTLVHLHLTGLYPNTLKGKENTSRPPAVLAGELYWKIPAEELRLISEPSQLRAIVQSRCKK